jgi:hypothetical protein
MNSPRCTESPTPAKDISSLFGVFPTASNPKLLHFEILPSALSIISGFTDHKLSCLILTYS